MAHFHTSDNPYYHAHPIQGAIFDSDGTLYAEPSNARHYHLRAAVNAVRKQEPSLSPDFARTLLRASSKTFGGSLDVFKTVYGLDLDTLRADHYDTLIAGTQDGRFFTPHLSPMDELSDLQNSHVRLAIATHANLPWTSYVLSSIDLTHIFDGVSAPIVCKDDLKPGDGKNISPSMYHLALDRLDVPETNDPSQRGVGYAMVEDTMENLEHAKALGMMTVLIDDRGRHDPAAIPDYVDVIVKNHRDAAAVILQSNNRHKSLHEPDAVDIGQP